jgi:large subunit ribosomal protein L22
MQVKAQLSNARIAPRKARLVRGMVVGQNVSDALAQLSFSQSKAAGLVHKLLKSAVANAENNNEMSKDNMRVKEVVVGDGIKFKRFQPVSRGMAHPYVKRNSNITVILEEIVPTAKKTKKEKADIKTLSLEELAATEDHETTEETKKKEKATAGGKVVGGAKEEASQKMKMKQQGGEKKKTYRRKSI